MPRILRNGCLIRIPEDDTREHEVFSIKAATLDMARADKVRLESRVKAKNEM